MNMASLPVAKNMDVSSFCSLPDHPKQRETTLRAIRTNSPGKHLSSPDKMHMDVKAVRYQGKIYKLDGHTRAILWKSGKLKSFSNKVLCIIYEAENEKEFHKMYDRCDSADSVEKGQDRIYSALKICGIKHKNIFKYPTHGLTSAMRELTPDYRGEKNMVPLVQTWLPEIKALSRITGLSPKIMPSSFIAGFIMTHRYARQRKANPASVIEFFTKYASREASTLEMGQYNAVYGLHELRHKAEKQKLLSHVRNNSWIASKVLKLWLHYKEHGDTANLQNLPNGTTMSGKEFLSKYCKFDDYDPTIS